MPQPQLTKYQLNRHLKSTRNAANKEAGNLLSGTFIVRLYTMVVLGTFMHL